MKFVFDLDGTICFKGQPLSAGIIAALNWGLITNKLPIKANNKNISCFLVILSFNIKNENIIVKNGLNLVSIVASASNKYSME